MSKKQFAVSRQHNLPGGPREKLCAKLCFEPLNTLRCSGWR